MAGSRSAYRHLGRTSAHREALLRNLVTSLIKHESILTTWPKAKEAQRVAERLITMAKKNNETARRHAQGILFCPEAHMPKLFGELRERYAERPGGYTRVLRTMPKDTYDQAPSAILELVDGSKDMRFAMTAAAVARDNEANRESNEMTKKNIAKAIRYRKNGEEEFDEMVERVGKLGLGRRLDGEANADSRWGAAVVGKLGI